MTDLDIHFADACQAFRAAKTALEAVDTRNRACWEGNPDWRKDWDLHADLIARLPAGRAEGFIDTMYHQLNEKIDLITAHRDTYIRERQFAYDALHAARTRALTLLGEHFGQRIVDANLAPQDLEQAIEDAFGDAQTMRQVALDGLRLAFDPEGPFTKALYAKVAAHLNIPVRGRRWIYDVAQTLHLSHARPAAPGF